MTEHQDDFVRVGPPSTILGIEELLQVDESAVVELLGEHTMVDRQGESFGMFVVNHKGQEIGLWSSAILERDLRPIMQHIETGEPTLVKLTYRGKKQLSDGRPCHQIEVLAGRSVANWLKHQ